MVLAFDTILDNARAHNNNLVKKTIIDSCKNKCN
jgi:hypothetical protein